MLKRLLRDRKGISLTEVVVAMTIVVMITMVAIDVSIASMKADAGFRDKYKALTACENAAECLRFSKGDPVKLKEALENAGFDGDTFDDGDHDVVVASDGNGNYFVKYNEEIIYTYNVN